MCVVCFGGLPFRHFILSYSGPSYYNYFLKTIGEIGEGGKLSREQMKYLVDSMGIKFYGYMLMVLGTLSAKVNPELFNLSFIAQYHGMSREGLNIFAKLGYICGLRTFDSLKREAILFSEVRYRYFFFQKNRYI